MAGSFLLEKEDRIATLIFNRPEKRNPLNEEVVLELEGLLHQVRDDRVGRTRVINPGALHRARPKTFAVLDLASGEIETVIVPEE